MAKDQQFSVSMDNDLIAALDVLKEIDRSSRATVIRNAVAEHVSRRRRAIQAHLRKQQRVNGEAA